MGAGLLRVLLLCCAALMAAPPAQAEDRSFGELLAKAKSQAAAGHRWAPPGDNMTETVMTMMDLIPSASAAQLAELSALLANDQSTPGRDQGSREAGQPAPPSRLSARPTVAPAPPSPEENPVPPPAAPAIQDRTLPDQPMRDASQDGPSPATPTQAAPSVAAANRTTAGQTAPGQIPSDQTATGQTAARRPADGPAGSNRAALNLAVPKQASASQAAPIQADPGQASANQAGPDEATTPARPAPVRTPAQVALGEVAPRANVPPPAAPSEIFLKQTAPEPAKPDPGPRAATLFARGLEAEHQGDFSGARRFYAIAAKLGEAAAARNLGRLFDPAYISRNALGGIDPDPALARQWYQRAVDLGDPEAGPLLEAMSMR
jgi:hypothetical protein